jgi:hypothetical protein
VLKREIDSLQPEQEISIVHLKPSMANQWLLATQPIVVLECLSQNRLREFQTRRKRSSDRSLLDPESGSPRTSKKIKLPLSRRADLEETENISTYQLRSVRH